MSRPTTYREQPSCATCEHRFVRTEYESGPCYYCQVDNKPRPLCGSVAMGEILGSDDDAWDEWEKWAEPREVSSRGICDEHTPPKGETTDEEWEKAGSMDAAKRASARVAELLGKHEPEPLDESIRGHLVELMEREANRAGMEKLPDLAMAGS